MTRALIHAAALGAAVLLLTGAAQAKEPSASCTSSVKEAGTGGYFSLSVENDVVGGTDRDYTTGTHISYLSDELDCTNFARSLGSVLPFFDADRELRYQVGVGQIYFTPEDTLATELVRDDRPYAGWLYASFGLVSYNDATPTEIGQMETLNIDIGVVGPWALAEEMQNSFHQLIGADESDGWSNQLGNEPGVAVSYSTKWRVIYEPIEDTNFGVDFMPHIGATVGNVLTDAAIGGTVRIGTGLDRDFGPPRIRPAVPGSSYFSEGGFDTYLFASIEGRAVGRDIFLDGNTFRDSHSVDKEYFVGDLQLGIAVMFDKWRVSYTHVTRSPQFQGDEWSTFGSLALSFNVGF
ncbi:MAG: lipid A deacylase LpxR family protein [Tistlia sp.]|uniref:lipid A deacylase LpxR family protein n=1 Tax=Tistlia sp. TaxID=3057121 RepID=UPI0034A36B10